MSVNSETVRHRILVVHIALTSNLYSFIYFSFELNTQIELPHTDKVTGLYFRPSYRDKSPMVVTTSADKKFKQWKIIDDTDLYSKYILVSFIYLNFSVFQLLV